MTSKIDSYTAALALRPGAARAAVKSTENTSGSSAEAATAAVVRIDTLRLTGDAVQLQRSEQALTDSSGGTSRVAQLKQAVASGTYQVDAGAVADKLLRMDWQLGAS